MAACATGTSVTTMVCRYTVAVGDLVPTGTTGHGIAIGANKLTGGTITATGTTTAAVLTHSAVASTFGHKVDGIRPTLLTIGTDAPTTFVDGFRVHLSFSESLGAVDHDKITIRANGADHPTSAALANGVTVQVTLATALTTTATNITVALGAGAVEDVAGNGILARAATGVSNAVGVLNLDPAFPSTEDGLRTVPEDTPEGQNVGAPVSAEDPESDALTYSLSGTDAGSFEIDSNGQLRVATGVQLDYERKKTYRVTVQVSDGKDQDDLEDLSVDDTQRVTITVTNVNEPPVVTGPSTASIAENSSSAVASYTAADPERDTLTWRVSDDNFLISDRGQLYFRTPPSFEQRTSYTADVIATDDDVNNPLSGSLSVTVTVTDAEEEGVVTIEPRRGWDGTTFAAVLDDGDGGITGETWQWERSSNGRSSWTDIAGETLSNYTAGADDVDQYLRATVTYTDGRSSGKEASATVTGRIEDSTDRPVSNAAPTFTETAPVTRSVASGTAARRNVGVPVRATDTDQGDVLTYSLDGTDALLFDIDPATGQVLTRAVLDYDPAGMNDYSVTVRVHDGYGPDYQSTDVGVDATITVTITVTAARSTTRGGGGGGSGAPQNRSPAFTDGAKTDRSVAENTPAGADIGEPVAATDREDDTLTYSLRGADAESFDIDAATGQLLTKAPLDHEAQAAYSVIVAVSDGKSSSGGASNSNDDYITVTITAANEDEPGTVSLSSADPDVDVSLIATLTDPDGGLDRVVWSWERSADQMAWTAISGAALASYTPVAADKGSYLRATASYTDGHGPRKSAQAATAAPVPSNTAPEFTDARDGAIELNVAENTGEGEAVGAPVAATDAEDDALTYALGGADAALFTIDEQTGQIRVGAGTTLDHEADKNVYTVDVTATDSSGLSATVTVTIAVTNVGLGSPLGDAYDADGNEAIDRDEAIAAVADYFADRITREEAIEVVQLYFAN